MRLMLEGKLESQEFINVLEGWLHAPEKAGLLRMNYSEEIIMFQVANKDYHPARVQSEQNLIYFLSEWGHLSNLSDKLRSEKLFNLRRVAEIHRCIEILLNDEYAGRVESLLTQWKNSSLTLNDSLMMWDFLIAYRTFFGNVLRNNYPNLDECISEMKLKFIDTAIQQKNYQLAYSNHQSLRNSEIQFVGEENLTKLTLIQCKLKNLKMERRRPTETLDTYLQSSQQIHNIAISDKVKEFSVDFRLQIYSELSEMLRKVLSNISKVDIEDSHRDLIMQLTPGSSANDLENRLQQQNLVWFIESVKVAEEISSSSHMDNKILGNVYYKLGIFCYDRMESNVSASLERNFVKSVLRGMSYNSKEARNLFPSLLEMNSLTNDSQISALFISESKKVPEWMFLNWVPQILARFNFDKPYYLDKILLRLAKMYPAAIVYSFTMSYSQYVEARKTASVDRSVVTKIRSLTNIPGAKQFISALSCLCMPKLMLYSHLIVFSNALATDSSISNFKKNKHIDSILRNVFREGAQNLQGTAFKQLEKYRTIVQGFKNGE